MWDYTQDVMDHFMNPRNVGFIEDADGVGEVGSLACGDALTLTFKLDKQGRIADVKFKTFGCASAVASSSVLTELIKGMTLEEAARVTNQDIVKHLGGLPDQKMHCSVMGQEALEAAINDYYKRKKGMPSGSSKGNIVCTCFGVTDLEVKKVVHENNLTTVEEVTNYCKAGGGCGGCHGRIAELIEEVQGEKARTKAEKKPTRPARLTNIQKIQLVQQTINEQIRPALRADGGDIELIDVDGNTVLVALRGMCAQCRLAEFTMKDVVQAKLREFVSNDLIVEEQKDTAGTSEA
ncbi:MAG: Fe-S cluster assembly protein NifU [Sedimentisphaerales bacterium]|nr:Fe-S cluster assembly protein NifU [Sedimentisphaerales bacterium]